MIVPHARFKPLPGLRLQELTGAADPLPFLCVVRADVLRRPIPIGIGRVTLVPQIVYTIAPLLVFTRVVCPRANTAVVEALGAVGSVPAAAFQGKS